MGHETILFVGPSGAGKDAVAERVSLLTGASLSSLSEQVRKEAKKAGLVEPTRSDLQLFANWMRETHGDGVFAKLAADDLPPGDSRFRLINGVRHPDEIAAFDHPLVISVNASRETRFERVMKRARRSDPKNWNEFLVCDEREQGTPEGRTGQQNGQCMAKADVTINNDSGSNDARSLESLEFAVDTLVDTLLSVGHLKGIGEITPDQGVVGRKLIVVTNGPHGAGKSSVGRLLSQELAIPLHHEIGGKLREEVRYNALASSAEFDREVMRRELLRDHHLLRDVAQTFILETWHTGNIAYALKRSPRLAQAYLGELKKQLERFDVLHLLFMISDENFLKRATEKVAEAEKGLLLDFYKEITGYTKWLYEHLGLKNHHINNDGSVHEAVLKAIAHYMDHIG